jgi:hypothetical protein
LLSDEFSRKDADLLPAADSVSFIEPSMAETFEPSLDKGWSDGLLCLKDACLSSMTFRMDGIDVGMEARRELDTEVFRSYCETVRS